MIQLPLMSFWGKHISPLHFYAFNKKSLIYLLETAGFEVVKTSGCIRHLPQFVNKILEPILQIWGGNIWVLVKNSNKKISYSGSCLPKWFGKMES